MEFVIRPVAAADWPAVAAVFNQYVRGSFAAFPAEPVPEAFLRERSAQFSAYPFLVVETAGRVVGFGFLGPFHWAPTLQRSGEVTYFLDREHTGMGIGGRLLAELLRQGEALGVRTVLARVSSLNEGSLRFHARHGFRECGRFREVGEKEGRLFDMVWFQRELPSPGDADGSGEPEGEDR
ncbi:MAG TPA: GNAT family N-acetyltransferase [Thermoanaerobaculia bacterium]|nr:GNAT family N-acetyltransferase [Thermoanaerobaculia bacterium]